MRFINAIKMFWWAILNPTTLGGSNLKLLSDLFALIFKASSNGKHYMTHISYITPENEEHEIVSLWAGSGVKASPVNRIQELLDENEQLKAQLKIELLKSI